MNFPKTKGGLWQHNKTSDKQPDVKGHIEITRDVLRMLVNQAKAGVPEIKLQISSMGSHCTEQWSALSVSYSRGICLKGTSRCCGFRRQQ